MARYIDADEVKLNVQRNLMPNVDYDGTVTVENAERYFLNLLDNTPTADVVEVVRCKECKHSSFIKSCSKYECKKGCGSLKYSNDYCSYGERKCNDD